VISEARKRCPSCGEDKPISAFGKRAKTPDGLNWHCRECVCRKVRESQCRKRKADPILYRAKKVALNYKVSVDEVFAFWQVPNCQCCGKPLVDSDLRIDHCHNLGHVRGVVCHLCNIAMSGEHGECMSRLSRAIQYLSRDLERQNEQG